MVHLVPIKFVFTQMLFISTTKSWVFEIAEAGWNWSSKSITCVFMAVFKAYCWKSLALFTRSYIPFSKTKAESVDLINTASGVGDEFSLAQIKMLLCPSAFHIVKWSWQWPPSCLIGLWTRSWMHCHTAIINWWVLWTSWGGLPVVVCCDAGQAPGWGCGFFPASYSFTALWAKVLLFLSYIASRQFQNMLESLQREWKGKGEVMIWRDFVVHL